ncbi:MAG: hypothetical protein KC591_01365 [Gemmatimonadetes bacterium]|nr:hypothetical protein [Gemmatimonadota bacterium]
MRRSWNVGAKALLPLVMIAVMAGCSEKEKIVYRDRDLFNPPADEAHGFLGYYDAETKMTTCGNCHVGHQVGWVETAHASAYQTLEDSGHAADHCYPCHTVNDQGNPLAEDGGWKVAAVEAYHDVQCESCHGAGLTHVENPDGSGPLASIAIPATFDAGCAECHQGTHHPFAEEWAQSGHGSVVEHPAGVESCQPCHTGQGALKAWGVNANYVEKDDAEQLAITCAVCHDPHNATYEHQLRFPVDTNSIELHLCARCHNRRTAPDASSSHGLEPHAPEAALLLGDAGWFPPNSNIDPGQIIASHGSEGNPTLCAACHVVAYDITDQDSGGFLFHSTGHLFTAIPCVDENGLPVPGGSCNYNETERSFVGCAVAGCHLTEGAAASALASRVLSITAWSNQLIAALEAVDPNLEAAGGEIDPTDPTFTVAEGAFYNYNLANFGGSAYGGATHNPFLTEALLIASLAAVQDAYPVPRSNVDYHQELQNFLARVSVVN